MECVRGQADGLHLLLGDFNTGLILVGVDGRFDFQSRLGGGAANELYDRSATDQRASAPVLGNMAEHPMLDLVPFAGTRRKVTHRNVQTQIRGKVLQFHFPEARPVAVSAASVGGDEESLRLGTAFLADFTPSSH